MCVPIASMGEHSTPHAFIHLSHPSIRSHTAPDGDEEVLELSVDVEELLKFESALEAALKDVKKRGQPSKEEQQRPVNVILNATNMHWLLSQVAYDIGVRQFAVPGTLFDGLSAVGKARNSRGSVGVVRGC